MSETKKYWLDPRDITNGTHGSNFWGEDLGLDFYGSGNNFQTCILPCSDDFKGG